MGKKNEIQQISSIPSVDYFETVIKREKSSKGKKKKMI
jgi:hypothetical protein